MKRITKIECAAALTLPKKKRVAAYARVSTSSEEQLLSLEVQKSHYEDYIKSNSDWEYAGLFYDEGISGTKIKNRTGLQNLLQASVDGKVDMIITKSISRFARNTTECLEMVRRLGELGVSIVFEKENIDTSRMENEFLLTVLASMAETESRSLSQNCKWAAKKRFADGSFVIGYPPYGYRNENGKMVILEEEAVVVRRIFSEALNGAGTNLIAKGLQKDGIPTRRGKKWRGSTVSDILKNEKYTGDIIHQKTYTDDNFTRHANHGEETMYLVQDHHEPIVSHEVFDKVQEILKQRGFEKGNNGNDTSKYLERYAFSGKIKLR
jgi:Site-specific recombinases, DNA invertase Pin homologs